MIEIPQWAVDELKALFEEHNQSWWTVRPLAKPIWKRLGWKPSTQQIYEAVRNISREDKFALCGKEKEFIGFIDGYKFCGPSKKCECVKAQVLQKSKRTNMERYGAESPFERKDIRDKSRATMRDRYGVEFTAQSRDLRDKMEATMIERHGVDNSFKSEETREKIRATMSDRYGVDNVMKNKEVRARAHRTNMEKFGSISPLGNRNIQEMSRKTMLERYGVDHVMKSEVFRQKQVETNKERYGVEYLQQKSEFREKSRETMLERYGVETPLLHQEFQEKRQQTNIERYGVPHAVQADIIKEKTKQKNIERYGVEHSAQKDISQESLNVLLDKDLLLDFIKDKSFNRASKILGINPATLRKYTNSYGHQAINSSYEVEMFAFLQTMYYGDIVRNDRSQLKNLELDFYLPQHNLAIEFNGIYWHSSIFKDSLYHRAKYEACCNLGIRLLMINEDEWLERSTVIKSRIQNILGLSPRGLPARKLHLDIIPGTVANKFFEDHHQQGRTGSIQYAVGAHDGDTLVAAMAFNKQRGTGAVELIRYATAGQSHAGLFTRLFKQSIRDNDYHEVVSFADLRYSQGNVYAHNGFDFVGEISPDYRYVWQNTTWHKSSFTKSQIEKRFGIDMSELTERQATEMLDIPRLYDCGKLKFVWTKEYK